MDSRTTTAEFENHAKLQREFSAQSRAVGKAEGILGAARLLRLRGQHAAADMLVASLPELCRAAGM